MTLLWAVVVAHLIISVLFFQCFWIMPESPDILETVNFVHVKITVLDFRLVLGIYQFKPNTGICISYNLNFSDTITLVSTPNVWIAAQQDIAPRCQTLFNSRVLAVLHSCVLGTKIQVGKNKFGRRFPSSEDIQMHKCTTAFWVVKIRTVKVLKQNFHSELSMTQKNLYRKKDPWLLIRSFFFDLKKHNGNQTTILCKCVRANVVAAGGNTSNQLQHLSSKHVWNIKTNLVN